LSNLKEAVINLRKRIEKQDYRGFDPYDALNSWLFKLPLFNKNKPIRFIGQQLIKRFPLNLRYLLAIPKGENPVSLGLSIQAYAYLLRAGEIEKKEAYERISSLMKRLEALIPNGYNGACWGYDFDWEARHANIPAYQPTVVATGIISNGLYEAYRITKIRGLADLVLSAANFIVEDLNRSLNDQGLLIFSYSPFDSQKVYNASMKGVRCLVQAYDLSGDKNLLFLANNAAKYVLSSQNEDGSWFYSEAKGGNWIDNYHTGYILDCLQSLEDIDPDAQRKHQIEKGLNYFEETFVGELGQPHFYSHRPWPVDCTAGGQQILTLTRFNLLKEANLTATYMINTMQKKSGGFAFRKFKNYFIRTEFMRWSNAWMFAALSYYLYKDSMQS
jgi:hypothetical protein